MNKFEKRSKESYDKKAEEYENTLDGRFTVKFKQILTHMVELQTGDVVLDVACGNGRLLKQLSEKSAIQGYGIDISDNMIAQAKQLNPKMDFQVGTCNFLPFEKEFCDVITVCASFHHFPDVQTFAAEAYRVMKKNATIYIAEIYLPEFLRVLCNPFLKFSKAGDVKFYAPEKIVNIFKQYGFSKKDIILNDNVQIVILQKCL